MMDQEAIKLLQKEGLTRAAAEEAAKALNAYKEGSNAVPFVVVPD